MCGASRWSSTATTVAVTAARARTLSLLASAQLSVPSLILELRMRARMTSSSLCTSRWAGRAPRAELKPLLATSGPVRWLI